MKRLELEWEREFLKSTLVSMEMMLGAFIDVYFRDKAGELKERTVKNKRSEQVKKLTVKVDRQQNQISRLTDKAMEQDDTIDRLQEKLSDLGHLERYFGRERLQSIVEQSKAIEQAERAEKHSKRAYDMGR